MRLAVDAVAIGVRSGDTRGPWFDRLDRATRGLLTHAVEQEQWKAERGEVLRIPVRSGLVARGVVLVGLGGQAATAHDARVVATHAARTARVERLGVVLDAADAAHVRAAAEGVLGGAYRFDRYRTKDRSGERRLREVVLVVGAPIDAAMRGALEAGRIVGESVCLVRDLVNMPPNDLTPTALAEAARAQCAPLGIDVTIWDRAQIKKNNMPLLEAVGRGSGQEPRFVHLRYRPRGRARSRVVFVGKGLTFDSGGLCIKTAKQMADMKCDMAGAAATIGIVRAAARLRLPVEVHGLLGCVENMSGDHAYRPGDVFPSRLGKTVEIINTDAEGRLVLADVLAYGAELEPDCMIDHATLTGACMVALGRYCAGLYANDETLAAQYLEAARTAGEQFWRMPLLDDLRETLRSEVADIKHTGDQYGGSITAALFLREFVGKTRWVHADIAGPAYLESPHDVQPKGGTGFGVATGVRFLESLVGG
ncbi:MAG: leucyl aminopeptidase [Myxococcota bacterium]|nr:leucyl aminopeptidase [Myxococcota bacterium]MDW8362374.1 leucyl aminopeptidase [Myxococcales bacterium]